MGRGVVLRSAEGLQEALVAGGRGPPLLLAHRRLLFACRARLRLAKSVDGKHRGVCGNGFAPNFPRAAARTHRATSASIGLRAIMEAYAREHKLGEGSFGAGASAQGAPAPPRP